MRWSELPPTRLEVELAKLGIKLDHLIWDGLHDPELKSILENLSSHDARRQVVLEWFGDEGHPQPMYTGRTHDWGRLPRLSEDVPSDRLQRRDPLPTRQTIEAVRLRVVERLSWPKIEEKVGGVGGLSHRKIDYIRLALKHEDLGWDLDRDGIALGPETRNTPKGLVLPKR